MPITHRLFRVIHCDNRLKLLAVVAALSVFWACYAGSKVGYSNPQEQPTVNQWLIEVKAAEVQIQLTTRSNQDRDGNFSHYSNTGFKLPFEQLIGLTRDQALSSGSHVQFQLKRDAGTFNFEGWFKDGNGSGHFTFSPNASFAAELSRQGFGKPTDQQLFSLAMHDVGFPLINELRAQGYEQFSLEDLVKMGNHGVRLDYVQGLKALGYSLKSTELLVRMKDHGVTLQFISDLAAAGFTGLAADELVRTKDHGVNAYYINEFLSAGYDRMTLDQWITLKDHGVNSKFVEDLKTLGYARLPLDDLRQMRDHGVTTSFIQELKELGYDRLPVEQLIRLKDHGVTANYIKKMKERGFNVSLDEYIQLRDRGTREE
jgi:hypothetical protein